MTSDRKDIGSMAKTKDKVLDYAGSAKPYVDRALHDDELRDHMKHAYEAAREIYDELVGRRSAVGLASRVATDKEIQENLKTTLNELRGAADRLQGKRSHGGRNTMLLLTGIALGVLFNPVTGPETRRWLKDKLAGGGGDFGFDSDGNGTGGGTSSS